MKHPVRDFFNKWGTGGNSANCSTMSMSNPGCSEFNRNDGESFHAVQLGMHEEPIAINLLTSSDDESTSR